MTNTTIKPPAFEFKVLKRHLKITPNGKDAVKLSLIAWSVLSSAKKHKVHGELTLAGSYPTTATRHTLRKLGVYKEVEWTQIDQRSWGRPRIDTSALSDRGVAIFEAMPKCPPRELWPESLKGKLSSPTNIRVSAHQQETIDKWTKTQTVAIPLRSTEAESGRWVSDRGGGRGTLKALFRMGLAEIGIRGVEIGEDGAVTLSKDASLASSHDVELVYRLTVAGALHADNIL